MALSVIMLLYVVIGLVSAAGAIAIGRRLLPGKWEQVFYGILLILIAAFYLVFPAYFGDVAAWRVEVASVAVLAVPALIGIRVPLALVLGYLLHGAWDLGHELQMHAVMVLAEPGSLTRIPLAYGVFCAAFDWCMAAYFFQRRDAWNAAWRRG